MIPVSDAFQAAVTASHVTVSKVEAWYGGAVGDPGVLIHPGLPVVDGTVTVDANSQVRRSLTMNVAAPELFPGMFDYSGPLAPYGTILRPYRGVIFPTGASEWVPLGLFRVDSPTIALESGVISVSASDLTANIQDARFLAATSSVTTNTIRAEIARLTRGALGPSFPVRDLTGNVTLTPKLVWDQDRWQAIRDLATSIGAEVIVDVTGQALIRPVPQVTDAVDWTVNEDEITVTGTRALDRAQVYNIVVATGERTDGTPPVRAVAQDTDPSSPTYVSGNFGPVPTFYSSPVLTTTAGCLKAANTILARTKALTRRVQFECLVNPAVEDGDVAVINFNDGTSERHIVDSIQVPLTPNATMRVTTRTSTISGLT